MNLLDSGKPPWTAGGWGPPPGKQGLPLVPVRVGSLVTGFWAAPRSCLLQPLPSWDFLLKSLQWPHGTGRSQPSLSGHAHLGLEACGPGGTTVLSSPARRDPACRFTYDLDPGGICALSRRPVPALVFGTVLHHSRAPLVPGSCRPPQPGLPAEESSPHIPPRCSAAQTR